MKNYIFITFTTLLFISLSIFTGDIKQNSQNGLTSPSDQISYNCKSCECSNNKNMSVVIQKCIPCWKSGAPADCKKKCPKK